MEKLYKCTLAHKVYKSAVTPSNKRTFNFLLVMILICSISYINKAFGQSVIVVNSQNAVEKAPPLTFGISQLNITSWNTAEGIPYKQVPGVNLGATSFEVIDGRRIAYLSNSTSEILITGKNIGKVSIKFPVTFAPRDFTFDKGKFYVLNEFSVQCYDEAGKSVSIIDFDRSYMGAIRIARHNNATYVLMASGNSLLIESNDRAIEPKEFEGWITSTGNRIVTKMNGDNTYDISVTTVTGNKLKNTFSTDKKVAGVFAIGATADRIILDLQTYISESPIQIERKIVSIKLNKTNLGNAIASIKVPDMYYVLTNKDFFISSKGELYNMITAPGGNYIYSLKEADETKERIIYYPAFLLARSYHFNDHLINPEIK